MFDVSKMIGFIFPSFSLSSKDDSELAKQLIDNEKIATKNLQNNDIKSVSEFIDSVHFYAENRPKTRTKIVDKELNDFANDLIDLCHKHEGILMNIWGKRD